MKYTLTAECSTIQENASEAKWRRGENRKKKEKSHAKLDAKAPDQLQFKLSGVQPWKLEKTWLGQRGAGKLCLHDEVK